MQITGAFCLDTLNEILSCLEYTKQVFLAKGNTPAERILTRRNRASEKSVGVVDCDRSSIPIITAN